MPKRARIGLAFVVLALLALGARRILIPPEPVYQGLPLSRWLERYQSDADSPETDEAVRAVGAEAIPLLLRNLRVRDSAVRLLLGRIGVHTSLAEIHHLRAEKGFSALGAAASNAVPALLQVYAQNASVTARHAAANALVEIGPAAGIAVPALAESCASTNAQERAFALYTLGRMALQPDRVVPILVRGLNDGDREVRYQAAFGLSSFAFMGGNAQAAIPALVQSLQDSYLGVRCGAAQALGQIHAETDRVVPALLQSLKDSDPYVRIHSAAALGRFGTNAKAGLEPLIEMMNDGTNGERDAASNALRQINQGR